MATYKIKKDEKYPWVNVITINSENPIDLNSDIFNITIKDILEYFVADHISTDSTFELQELYKKDTYPTIEICKNSVKYGELSCFNCEGTGKVKCNKCKGKGYYFKLLSNQPTLCEVCNHTGKIDCDECSGTGIAHTICYNDTMKTEYYENTIPIYNNLDEASLIKNGIQFWLKDNKTLIIKVVTKGKSTLNNSGYIEVNPITNEYYPTGYIGFTLAQFNITLNNEERLSFICNNVPKIEMGDPIPNTPFEPISSYCDASAQNHIISGALRADYDWNGDGAGTNNLFVNNTNGNYKFSNNYYQIPIDEFSGKWITKNIILENQNETQKYIIKSSAYLTDYLINGITIDLYNSEDSAVSAIRGFNYTSANVKSYLYNEYTFEEINLPFEFNQKSTINDFIFYSANGEYVYDDLYCYEIIQSIEDSSCSGKIRKNQVKLELEI